MPILPSNAAPPVQFYGVFNVLAPHSHYSKFATPRDLLLPSTSCLVGPTLYSRLASATTSARSDEGLANTAWRAGAQKSLTAHDR